MSGSPLLKSTFLPVLSYSSRFIYLFCLFVKFIPIELLIEGWKGREMLLMWCFLDIVLTLFSNEMAYWQLFFSIFSVFKNGMYCSLFEVVEKTRSGSNLEGLLQKLETDNLVSIDFFCAFIVCIFGNFKTTWPVLFEIATWTKSVLCYTLIPLLI